MPITQEKTFTVEAVLKGIHTQAQAKQQMESATGAAITLEEMSIGSGSIEKNPTFKLSASLTTQQVEQLKETVVRLFKENALFALMFLKVDGRLFTVSRHGAEEMEGAK